MDSELNTWKSQLYTYICFPQVVVSENEAQREHKAINWKWWSQSFINNKKEHLW